LGLEGSALASTSVNHLIYTAIPYKGYGIRAWSSYALKEEVKEAFKEWPVPYDQRLFKPGYEARAVIKTFKGKVNLARIFIGSRLDELGRDAIVSHIASVSADLFDRGLSFSKLERAMVNHISASGVGLNEVQPIEVSWAEGEKDEELEYLKATVSRENAKKILEGFEKPHPKILVIFSRDLWSRIKLTYSVSRLLLIHGLSSFAVLSDRPLDQILYIFDNIVIISDKMLPIRAADEWTIVNLKRIEGEQKTMDVEKTLDRIYSV